MRKWQWKLRRLFERLWVRAVLYSILGVITAFAAVLLDPFIPDGLEDTVGAGAIDTILNILATSMLTITTFSLTTMVTAFTASTQDATPRATRLLMADTTTHSVLATFIGTFLYSLVGIIVLSMEAYGSGGRVVLFAVTMLVIIIVIAALLRWIDHLTRLGRVNETTRTVELAAQDALQAYHRAPTMGAVEIADDAVPQSATRILADDIGYVGHVDMQQLETVVAEAGAIVTILARPGTFVHTAEPLVAVISGSVDAEEVRAAFTIGRERTFEEDPLFGLAVLSEIASRALSPGINDQGTALDVLGRGVRLIAMCSDKIDEAADAPEFPHLRMTRLPIVEFLDHLFTPVARDGADKFEVQVKIQKSLAALIAMDEPLFGAAARHVSRVSLDRAEATLTSADDIARVRKAAASLS
jgi:uncharacterized membrane protein